MTNTLTPSQAAAQTGVNAGTLREMLRTGRGPRARRVNGRWYIASDDLHQWHTKTLNAPQAAALIGVSGQVLRSMLRKGEGPRAQNINGKWWMNLDDVHAWIEQIDSQQINPPRP